MHSSMNILYRNQDSLKNLVDPTNTPPKEEIQPTREVGPWD